MKKLVLAALCLSLAACNTMKPIVHTEYKEVLTPVAVVPMPPEVEKPVLATTTLSEKEKDDLGALVKAYVIENEQLAAYAKLLEEVIAEYKRLALKSTDGYELVVEDGKVVLKKAKQP